MAFAPEKLRAHTFGELRQSYSERDAILYALGLGYGAPDETDKAELDYLLEYRLKVLPMMAVVLASPGMWIREPQFGINYARVLHTAQEAQFHAPLPPAAEVKATPRIAGLYDRGAERGVVVVIEREIRNAANGQLLSTVRQTVLLRDDGGFGGAPAPVEDSTQIPDRAPDAAIRIATSKRAALIYRLSGDYNPLHADPAVARSAGFSKPILHGLATYGVAGRALMQFLGKPLTSLGCRFSAVVYPGEIVETRIWRMDDGLAFEAYVEDRKVLSRGRASV